MDQKPTTIKEIAKRLSVSVSTVSRALHNHPSIGLRTRMQVQKLAQELSYEPNQAVTSCLDHPPIASVEQFPYQQAEKATAVLLQLIRAKGQDLDTEKKIVLESRVVLSGE